MLHAGIKESTATTGTGTVTLSSMTGYARFSNAFQVGQQVSYAIEDGNNIEWGIGTIGSSNTLARTVVQATLVSGTYNNVTPSAITLSGSAIVSCQQHDGSVLTPFQGARLSGVVSGGLSNNLIPSNLLADADYGTLTLVANTLYLYPVLLLCTRRLSQLGLRVSTLASTKLAAIGIFDTDPANGGPGKTLAEISGLSVGATGEQMGSLAAEVQLSPGWYWAGVVSDGTPGVNGVSLQLPGPLGMQSNRVQRYMTRTNNYAAFSTNAFTNSSGSLSNVQNTNLPLVLYK